VICNQTEIFIFILEDLGWISIEIHQVATQVTYFFTDNTLQHNTLGDQIY